MPELQQFGYKRRVVGARNGTMDFIIQRVTAVILAVYSILFLLGVLFTSINYESWKGFFTFTWWGFEMGRMSASLAFFAMAYHAWIGVRDIWMDYVRPYGARLALQVVTVLWLIASVVYFVKVIWSI